MKQTLNKIITRHKPLVIIGYIVNNYYNHFKRIFVPKKAANSARSTADFDQQVEINKAKEEYQLYKQFGDFSKSTILEIGPGAYTLNPLYFLLDGAKKYVALDLFYSIREPENSHLLKTIYKQQQPATKKILEKGFDSKNNKLKKTYFSYILKNLLNYKPSFKFKYILSYATLEHIHEIKEISQKMHQLLEKKGKVISFICNNDHGMFDKKKFSDFEFYTISPMLYKHMTKLSGRPNRYTPETYKEVFLEAGFSKVEIYAYRTIKGEILKKPRPYETISLDKYESIFKELKQHKKRFVKKYQEKENREFLFDYFILVATK